MSTLPLRERLLANLIVLVFLAACLFLRGIMTEGRQVHGAGGMQSASVTSAR